MQTMKKFNRLKHKTMGALPDELRQYIGNTDVSVATAEFNQYMTELATNFHRQLAEDIDKKDIKLTPSRKLFGCDVSLDYVASGSVGSVYKMHLGDKVYAFKINRNSSHGELNSMPLIKRARGLVNKTYFGSVFEFNGRKYSWVISDFIAKDYEKSFENAMKKLYYAYLTKGISISDAHPNNFKDGKLIDTPSLDMRDNKIDDIKKLNRSERDIVQQLVYFIKTNDLSGFTELTAQTLKTNPAVISYMFFAMQFAKGVMFSGDKTDDFSVRLRQFDSVINSAWRSSDMRPTTPSLDTIKKCHLLNTKYKQD